MRVARNAKSDSLLLSPLPLLYESPSTTTIRNFFKFIKLKIRIE